MDIRKCITALAAAVTIALWPAQSAAAYTRNFSGATVAAQQTFSSSVQNFTSVGDAAEYLRGCIRSRQTNITFGYSVALKSSAQTLDSIFLELFSETGRPDEGDYIRYGLYSYGVSMSGNSSRTVYTLELAYFTNAQQERYVDSAVSSIISKLSLSGKSEYEKIAAIYEYIVSNVKYADDLSDETVYSAYGALANGKAVCQGFAQLFYRLASEAGISSRVVAGTAGGGDHAWNIASINGWYYLLDSTWDSNMGSGAKYFFLKGTSDFDANYSGSNPHKAGVGREGAESFYPDYTSAEFAKLYPIAVKAYSASDKAPSFKRGDINGDSAIDGSDATMALRAYAEISSFGNTRLTGPQRLAADADSDGKTDGSDATVILRYYALASTNPGLTLEDCMKIQP